MKERAIEKFYTMKAEAGMINWTNVVMGQQIGLVDEAMIRECGVNQNTFRSQLRQDGFHTRKFNDDEIWFAKNKSLLYN